MMSRCPGCQRMMGIMGRQQKEIAELKAKLATTEMP